MNAFTSLKARDKAPLRWVVAAPGEGAVNWERIVSEDEDGMLSGWAREVSATPANGRMRRRA